MEGGLTFRMQVVRQSPSCFYTLRIKKKIPAGCHFLNVDKSTALDKNLNEGIKQVIREVGIWGECQSALSLRQLGASASWTQASGLCQEGASGLCGPVK